VHEKDAKLKRELESARQPQSGYDIVPTITGGAAGGSAGFMHIPYADPEHKKKKFKRRKVFDSTSAQYVESNGVLAEENIKKLSETLRKTRNDNKQRYKEKDLKAYNTCINSLSIQIQPFQKNSP